MFRIENLKRHSTYTVFIIFFIMLSLITLGSFQISEYSKQNKLDLEWDIIEDMIRISIDESHRLNKINVNYVERKIKEYYEGNSPDLEYHMKNLSDNNVLTKILARSLKDDILFDMDKNKYNSNSPFYISREKIEVDKSTDRSAEIGSNRTFDEEVLIHFNQVLAEKAIIDLLKGNKEYTVWHYKKIDKSLPFYNDIKDLKYVDIKVLKKLFYENNGDYRVLQGFEFVVPEYIYRNEDLLGNKIVDSTGHKVSNYQLILCQGFNIVDVLEHNNHLQYMRQIETSIEHTAKIITITSGGILIISLILFAWVASKLNKKSSR